ncbi:MAG: hypothetical protein GXP37_04470 [Chloroflexi bacterium]|nr:hypothetical protein [Chloroflexota bacterium]
MSDLLGMLTALVLTLALFSRIWRPNRAFRWASHLLLGAWMGYIAAVVLKQILWGTLLRPFLQMPLAHPETIIALALILLLALRLSRRPALRAWGILPLGMLAGGGSALLVAGALRGSLLPQLLVPAQLHFLPDTFPWWDAAAVTAATFATIGILIYFNRRSAATPASHILDSLSLLGYYTLMIGFGALLATTAGARITLLIDRMQYLITLIQQLFGIAA